MEYIFLLVDTCFSMLNTAKYQVQLHWIAKVSVLQVASAAPMATRPTATGRVCSAGRGWGGRSSRCGWGCRTPSVRRSARTSTDPLSGGATPAPRRRGGGRGLAADAAAATVAVAAGSPARRHGRRARASHRRHAIVGWGVYGRPPGAPQRR